MPTLHIRSVPEELYVRVQELAQYNSRSLSAQVVTMLFDALEEEERRREQGKALKAIRRRRFVPAPETPNSTHLLREDRQR